MKLKIGYLYRDGYGDIFAITKNNSVNNNLCKSYPYVGSIINEGEIDHFYTDTGKYNDMRKSPTLLDLIEEIGKAEDNPEYFL